MKNGIVVAEKSKLYLASAVLFAITAILFLTSKMIESWQSGLFQNFNIIIFFLLFLGDTLEDVFGLLAVACFFVSCILLYFSKITKLIPALISIAAAIEIGLLVKSMLSSWFYLKKYHLELPMGFGSGHFMINYFPKIGLILVWIVLILTLLKVIKTRNPVLLCSVGAFIAVVVDFVLEQIPQMNRMFTMQPIYVILRITDLYNIFLWAAVCLLVLTLPRNSNTGDGSMI